MCKYITYASPYLDHFDEDDFNLAIVLSIPTKLKLTADDRPLIISDLMLLGVSGRCDLRVNRPMAST